MGTPSLSTTSPFSAPKAKEQPQKKAQRMSKLYNDFLNKNDLLFYAPILDVGLLTVVGVSCEVSVHPAHTRRQSAAPQRCVEARWKGTD